MHHLKRVVAARAGLVGWQAHPCPARNTHSVSSLPAHIPGRTRLFLIVQIASQLRWLKFTETCISAALPPNQQLSARGDQLSRWAELLEGFCPYLLLSAVDLLPNILLQSGLFAVIWMDQKNQAVHT